MATTTFDGDEPNTTTFDGDEPTEVYRERNRWLVEALRSGDYEQGMGTLQQNFTDENGVTVKVRYCCLCVACQVAMARGLSLLTASLGQPTGLSYYKTNYIGPSETVINSGYDVPPSVVQNWFGWYDNNPLLRTSRDHDYIESAATLNDNGATFEEIAAAFERTFVTAP